MKAYILGVLWLALMSMKCAQGSFPADIKTKYETYLKEFDNTRGHLPNTPALDTNRQKVRNFIKTKLEAAGLQVMLQNFATTDTNTGQSVSGTNVIGILKGSLHNTAADEVIVIAAHTDTPGRNAGGANNDGSGLVGLLAIAEALKGSDSCTRNNSVVFAAFDRSETFVIGNNITQCKKSCGSAEFIKNKATYIGSGKVKLAIVLDCIANMDYTTSSQVFDPVLSTYFPEFVGIAVASDSYGDYLAMVGRNNEKSYLDEIDTVYKASKVDPNSYVFGSGKFQWSFSGVPSAANRTTINKAFKDGDHMSFWDANINAVLLTDTCYERGYMKNANCKIDPSCDAQSKITADGYQFMYSILLTATKITNKYTCSGACAGCDPNAECKNDKCVCNSGYSGSGSNCTDINECKQNPIPCDKNADCLNTKGSYKCTCKDGYTGSGKTCTDINECKQNPIPCDQNADCLNTEGSYKCTCKNGYSGSGQTCTVKSSASSLQVISQVVFFCLSMILSYHWI